MSLRLSMNDNLIRDLRYGARQLARHPGLTLVVVGTLALAMGATTSAFSVLDAVVLQDLPFRGADRLAIFWVDFGDQGQSLPAMSAADFRDCREQAEWFDEIAAGTGSTANLTGSGEPEQVDLGRVSHDFFSVFSVEPALGRGFLADEDVVNGPAVAILSDALWKRRFAGDPAIVGKSIELNGVRQTVVGVLPAGFRLPLPPETILLRDADVWVPLQPTYDGPRNRTLLTVFGRLKAEADFARAGEEMAAIAARLREQHAVHKASDTHIRVVPLHQAMTRNVRPGLVALTGAAVLLLLIACGNVAGLLMTRGLSRGKELAIRVALGARRGQIVRQLLVECALMVALGGLGGILLAAWAIDLLPTLQPAHLPPLGDLSVAARMPVYAAVGCLFAVVLVGVAPALRATRRSPDALLREGGPGQVTPARRGASQAVVVGQVALSLMLLVGVGLLLRSFLALQQVRPGFETDAVYSFQLFLPPGRYPEPRQRAEFYEGLEARLRALPGVMAVGAVSQVPLSSGGSQAPYAYDDVTEQRWESVTADARVVTPGYFAALGSRFLAGRPFDARDRDGSPLVVIVDSVLAGKAWPNRDPIGRPLLLPVIGPHGVTREWMNVIGVVEHQRLHDLSREVRGEVFFPHAQGPNSRMTLVVKAAGDPTALYRLIGAEVRALDRELPMHNARPLGDYVAASLAQSRFMLVLLGVYGLLALVLALVGLYGVVSQTVSRRMREFGLRLALGADAGSLFRLILRQGIGLVVAGLIIGVLGALAAGRAISGFLYGLGSDDPSTYAAALVVLFATSLLACCIPARRATRADPMVALRSE